jgi:hypothetical protein
LPKFPQLKDAKRLSIDSPTARKNSDSRKSSEIKDKRGSSNPDPVEESINPSWSSYREELLQRGRAVVVESNSNTIEFNQCFFKGRVGGVVLGLLLIIFNNPFRRKECNV